MRYLIFSLYSLFIILISILAYLNVLPTKEIKIPYYDYAGHFILYGIWAYLAALAFNRSLFKSFSFPIGIVVISVVTVIEEYLQSFSSVRTSSLSDLICSLLGITIALILFNRNRISRTT